MRVSDLQVGDSFVARSSVKNQIPHLHFILTKPEGTPPTALVVNITSYKDDLTCEDKSLLLGVGDHEFITNPSYTWFAQTTEINVDELVTAIGEGLISMHERCSSELMTKLRTGVLKSDEVVRKLKIKLVNAIQAEKEAIKKAPETDNKVDG